MICYEFQNPDTKILGVSIILFNPSIYIYIYIYKLNRESGLSYLEEPFSAKL